MPKAKAWPRLTDAQRALVEDNIGLVYQAVSDLFKGLYEYEDLVQVGSIGLCQAALGYKPEMGISFSTFASVCIRKQILRHNQIWTRRKKRDITKESYSLDERLCRGEETFGVTHADLLTESGSVEDAAIAGALMDVVNGIENERLKTVMLEHISGMTLEEIGQKHGFTRSRAGQLLFDARRAVRARWGA